MRTFLVRLDEVNEWLRRNIYYFDETNTLQMLPLSIRSNISINVPLYYKYEEMSIKEKIKYRDIVIECEIKPKTRSKKY